MTCSYYRTLSHVAGRINRDENCAFQEGSLRNYVNNVERVEGVIRNAGFRNTPWYSGPELCCAYKADLSPCRPWKLNVRHGEEVRISASTTLRLARCCSSRCSHCTRYAEQRYISRHLPKQSGNLSRRSLRKGHLTSIPFQESQAICADSRIDY